MQAKAVWTGRLSFTGTADSGFTVPMGTDTAFGGDNDGFRPIELVAVSLAGCTAMDVISTLTKMRQPVSGFEVQIDADRADEHPRVFTHMRVKYVVHGTNIDEKAVQRAIDLSLTKYCPVGAMLGKAAKITHHYTIEAPTP